MLRDVSVKENLTEIRLRPRFAFVDSSHTSRPLMALGSDNTPQETGAAFTGPVCDFTMRAAAWLLILHPFMKLQ